jgi:hypothetical protein
MNNGVFNGSRYADLLSAAIPPHWLPHLSTPAPPTREGQPYTWQAEQIILDHLTYKHPTLKLPTALSELRVRQLTAMQPMPEKGDRMKRMQVYVIEAGIPADESISTAKRLLERMGTQLWRLRWENRYKEALWRLIIDGIGMYGSARFTNNHPHRCLCNTGDVSRAHHFWDCPIAMAVVTQIQGSLPLTPTPLTRINLWLLKTPEGIHVGVWDVVVLAAITAMERGRRLLTSLHLTDKEQVKAAEEREAVRRVREQQRQQTRAHHLQLRGLRHPPLPPPSPLPTPLPLNPPHAPPLPPPPAAEEQEAVRQVSEQQ